MKHRIEFFLFYLIARILYYLPYTTGIKLGEYLGRLFYRVSRSRRNITAENLSTTLGIEGPQAEEMALKVMQNVGATFAEFLKIPGLDERFFTESIEVEGFENYLEAKKMGKGVFLLSAHIGNWEILGASHQRREPQSAVVFRKTSNPYVNAYIESIRKGYVDPIPSKDAARKIMAALKKGGSVGILLDQHAVDEEAIIVDFLGRPAATSYGLALIALKTGTPVVPVFMLRKGGGKFRCVYERPICLKKDEDLKEDIRQATIDFNEIIGKYVKMYPEQWFWIHRRWKV
ncbi:MAG: lysophospholipid acyltransferase family protein [Proteobacteria bacterium]|nr:lysophospholipid acyltransferase family protein [Pseudomonadota bacterium]